MIWFNELLRGPAAKSPEHPAAAAPSAVDPDTARAALAAASGEEQQRRHAEALGCALAALQKAPLPADGPGVWAAAISHLADKSIALQWIEHLSGDGWLGEVAASGRFAEVRLAAAQRIEDRAVLRQLSHLSRGRDKAVFRHCSDVLRKDRQAAGRAQRAAQLAADLRDLLDHAPLSVSCLLDLQRELHALGNGSEAPLPECSVLLEQAEARLRQESEARRALQACRAEAAELLAQCTAAGPTLAAEQLDGWRDRFSGLAQVHTGLPPWLAGKAAHQALESLLRQLESRLTAIASEPEQAAAPEPPAPAIEIAATPEPAAKPPVDLAAVRALLERMEQALEQGHLGEADAAAKQIKATVAGGALHGNLAARLQRAQARLAELSDWAKWGAQKKREQLIAAAQSLLAGSHEVEHLARAVPALREEWKQVTGQTAPTQGEWGRFDAALEKAYRPVAARHAEEAARRSKARADKEALCAEWEAAAAAIDWERADYTAVEAQRQRVLDRWRGAPLAGFRDERALRKRLEKTLGEVDQRLAAARAAEIGRREELIAVAEALREAPDLRSAISETRTLQQRWRDEAGPLRLTRFDEQKLWRRFRAACDAVFTRRDAERAEQVVQREKRAQTRATLLDGFAAAWPGMDASQLKRALAQFRSDWDGTRTGRAEATDALDQRARAQQQQAQRRIDELQRHAYRDRLERMAQQAAPAADLDAEALAAGRKERELLLIDLEIALDLPTPEAFAQARRRRQLERLQVRFRGDRPQQPRAEDLLARLYAAPAGPDAEMDARLAAVVGRLIEQGTAAAR